MKFLQTVWLTVKAAPVYLTGIAGTLAALVADPAFSQFLPVGVAGAVIRVAAIVGILGAAGAKIVTLSTPVVKEARGFPKPPASTRERLEAAEKFIADVQALAAASKVIAVEAVADVAATADPTPAPVVEAPVVEPVAEVAA